MKNVLITGASSGIGRAIAMEYAKQGAHIVVTARREPELLSLCDEIKAAGGKGSHIVCDVADPHAAYALAAKGEDIMGSLDIIIANAGVSDSSPATRMKLDTVLRTLSVNVNGAIATLLGAIPIMLAQQHGHLVSVTSLAGRRVLPGSVDYSASKAALSTFTEGLILDLRDTKLKVTDVQPGFVETPMTAKNTFKMPFLWDAPKAASYIVKKLESAPAIVAFPPQLDFLTRLSQMVPLSVHGYFTTSARKRPKT